MFQFHLVLVFTLGPRHTKLIVALSVCDSEPHTSDSNCPCRCTLAPIESASEASVEKYSDYVVS